MKKKVCRTSIEQPLIQSFNRIQYDTKEKNDKNFLRSRSFIPKSMKINSINFTQNVVW